MKFCCRLLMLVLVGEVLGIESYKAYPPPFLSASVQKSETKLIPGRTQLCFQGTALSLISYPSVEPAWFSPDMKIRYGGSYGMLGGRVLTGARRSFAEDASLVEYKYPEHPGLSQKLKLEKDGSILLTVTAAPEVMKSLRWEWSLLGEFFGGSLLGAGGRTFRLPPYTGRPENSRRLYAGSGQEVVFFADMPEKRIVLRPDAGVNCIVHCNSGQYGLRVSMQAAAGTGVLRCRLLPGRTVNAPDARPPEYLTRIGKYDFWQEDRLRLPDRRNRRNLLANSSLELGFASLWFPLGGGVVSENLWKNRPIFIDDREAFIGRYSLGIRSDRRMAGLSQHIGVHPVFLTPGTYTVSFYARTDQPGRQTILLNDMMLPPGANIWSGKVMNQVVFTPTDQWKRYSRSFEIRVPQPHYFTLMAKSQIPAVCRIDALQLERGKAPTDYEPAPAEGRLKTAAADNFLEFGQRVRASLEIITAKPRAAGSLECIVRDFFGQEIRREKHDFTTDGQGRREIALNLEKMPRGIFTVENRYHLADGGRRYEFTRFAVMDFLHNTHKHKNLFANAYIDPYSDRQFYYDILERYRRVGIGSRSGFANTEKLVAETAAGYGVDSTSSILLRKDEQFSKGLKKPCAGFSVLNNVVWYETLSTGFRRQDYGVVTLPFSSPEALKPLEAAAARKSRENPWVQVWSASGEVEGFLPEFAHSRFATEERFRQFVDLEIAACRGLKKGNPRALVGNSPTSCLRSDRFEMIDRLLEVMGNRFRYDCFLFHVYREAPEYPDLDRDFQKVCGILEKHGYKDEPIYCPEGMHWKPYRMPGLISANWIDIPWGPFSYDMGHEERLSSAWRARTWLIGLKHARRVKVINSSTNFWSFEMDCGLTPFATQKISNTLGRLLGNADFVREIRLSAGTRCYLFRDEYDRPVAALWSCDPEVDRGRKLGPVLKFAARPAADLFDLMEVPRAFAGELRLTPFPVFLRGHSGSLEGLAAALEQADLMIENEPAAAVRFSVEPLEHWRLHLDNRGRQAFEAEVLLNSRSARVSLASGEKKSLRGRLPVKLSADRLGFEQLRAEIRQTRPRKGTYFRTEEVTGVLAGKAEITVDGETGDWAGIPALPVEQANVLDGAYYEAQKQKRNPFGADLKLAWKDGRLFMLVEVRDRFRKVSPQKTLADGWRNDSLQIYFDTFADGRQAAMPGLGVDDWAYGVYMNSVSEKPVVYRHHAPDPQLTEGVHGARPDTVAPEVECVCVKTAAGYRYELSFPPKSLLPFRAAAGNALGVGVVLNNRDKDGTLPQFQLFWARKPDKYNHLPGLWPLVILVDRKD